MPMTFSSKQLTKLSKVLSHALRHEPWLYELEPDSEGWVPLGQLLKALKENGATWGWVSAEAVAQCLQHAEKQRHELKDGHIRALYGHSIPAKIHRDASPPPDTLFHGTSPESAAIIAEEGLLPMGRQYVHLSADRQTAEKVGRRKASAPIILIIKAKEAAGQGCRFYRGSSLVWLADAVPARFIDAPG